MNRKRIWTSFFLVMFVVAFFFMTPITANAASIKNAKPTIKKAQYLYDSVSLEWNKVTGAKKYQIQRRVMNPKTGKWGKYKLWATTSKTSIVKKATGDYQYRVRAVKGKTYSKWSSPKRVFAAYARIVDRTYEAGAILNIKIKVTNKTKSPMGLMKGYIDDKLKSQVKFYQKGKLVDTYHADLYSGSIWTDDNLVTDKIPANKTKTINLTIRGMSTGAWWGGIFAYYSSGPSDLEHANMRIVTPFYPNPTKENTKLKISYTKKASQSVTR